MEIKRHVFWKNYFPEMDYTKFQLEKIVKLFPISNGETKDCLVCKSKIESDGKSWMNLSTGIKATYWVAFCAVSAICVLFPNEEELGTTLEEQTMTLHQRMQANDLLRIFDD